MRARRSIGAAGALALLATSARAAEPPPPPPPERSEPAPPPKPERRPGEREHDGFFLRAALGFGAYREEIGSDEPVAQPSGDRVEVFGAISGIATAGELSAGFTPWSGMVLGIGVYRMDILVSTFVPSDPGEQLPTEIAEQTGDVTMVGPFLDYYPDPLTGWHLQTAIGFMARSAGQPVGNDDDDRYTAFGGGVLFGVGHEWWVASELSVGVLGRLIVGSVAGEDESGSSWMGTVASVPSVLFSVTYH